MSSNTAGETPREPTSVRFVRGFLMALVAAVAALGVAGPVLIMGGTMAAVATYVVLAPIWYLMIRTYRRTGIPWNLGVME